MAPIPDHNFSFHGSLDWAKIVEQLKELSLKAIQSIGIFFIIYSVFIFVCLIYRLMTIKFGRTIKPSGKKAIIITGATSGIGLALAKYYYKMGFTVFACYFESREPGYAELLELSKEVPNTTSKSKLFDKPSLFLVHMDQRSLESIENSSVEINELLDKNQMKLHCLINNAGVSNTGPFEWMHIKFAKVTMDTNYTGVILVTKTFIKRIIQDKARIINTSSVLAICGSFTYTIYGSAKSGLAYFTDALREDIGHYGCKCINVFPGSIVDKTKIAYNHVKSNQESIKELSEDEKELYSKSIELISAVIQWELRAKLLTETDDLEKVAELYGIEIPSDLKNKKLASVPNARLRRFINLIVGACSQPIEKSCIIESYEKAVTSKSPWDRYYPAFLLKEHEFGLPDALNSCEPIILNTYKYQK